MKLIVRARRFEPDVSGAQSEIWRSEDVPTSVTAPPSLEERDVPMRRWSLMKNSRINPLVNIKL
jgi:hypothetical protein